MGRAISILQTVGRLSPPVKMPVSGAVLRGSKMKSYFLGSYVTQFLCTRRYVVAAVAGLLRHDFCAFEFSAGATDEWLALEDAFDISGAAGAGFRAGRVALASL